MPDGTCETLTESDCAESDGDYQGDDTFCDPNPCPQPTGACCVDQVCVATNTQAECDALEGDWYEGETCLEFLCQSPCEGDTLEIFILSDEYPSETTWELYEQEGALIASGGPLADVLTMYAWDVCLDPNLCYDFTIYDSYGDGICCEYGDGYYELYVNAIFVGSGGEFVYDETTAVGNGCGQLTGACCLEGGTCVITTAEMCSSEYQGEYYGDGTTCDPNPCPQPDPDPEGACWLDGPSCRVLTEAECLALEGHYSGDGSDCFIEDR